MTKTKKTAPPKTTDTETIETLRAENEILRSEVAIQRKAVDDLSVRWRKTGEALATAEKALTRMRRETVPKSDVIKTMKEQVFIAVELWKQHKKFFAKGLCGEDDLIRTESRSMHLTELVMVMADELRLLDEPLKRTASADNLGRAVCPHCGMAGQDTRRGEGVCMVCGGLFEVEEAGI